MFEISILRKYLIPRKKQLSMTLIALMSVGVISLVVWLIVLFLSVTEGIEKTWLEKLTSINAPLRITPTQNYYSSYYYLADSISSSSQYTPRSLSEKIAGPSDPHNPDADEAIPSYWPKPERNSDGSLKDPVKTAYSILSDLKKEHADLSFQDFEMSGAMLKLELIRPSGSHSFLSQASYLASFADRNPSLKNLIAPPSMKDLNNLFFLSSKDGDLKKIKELLSHITIKQLKTRSLLDAVDAELIQSSLDTATQPEDIQFNVNGGAVSLKDIEIESADIDTSSSPFWVHGIQERLVLPTLASKERGILLSKQFHENGVRIGDKGWLSYPAATSGGLQEQRLSVFVAGFYDPGVVAIGNKCILAPANVIHMINTTSQVEHFDKTSAAGFAVWIKEIKNAPHLAKELERRLKEAQIDTYWKVTTYRDYDFAKDLLQQFQSDRYLFTLIGLVILLVACSNIISFLVILVNDKKQEIGILQALGASRKSIALIFGGCGACLGILSSLIGVGTALLTLKNLDKLVQFLSFIQGHDAFNAVFYGSSLPHTLSFQALIFVLVITPILSLIAGLIPAWKACRLSPSAILRSE